MILRAATFSDAGAICDITNSIIRDTLITFTTVQKTTADIADQITRRGPRFLVAETDGQVVGFATYGPFRAGPGYAQTAEHTIQLAPSARGQGIGRALMQKLEHVADQDGIQVLVAGISSANPDAVAFHTRLGFDQVGLMPGVGFKAGQWLDLILMQKRLAMRPQTAPDSAPSQV